MLYDEYPASVVRCRVSTFDGVIFLEPSNTCNYVSGGGLMAYLFYLVTVKTLFRYLLRNTMKTMFG